MVIRQLPGRGTIWKPSLSLPESSPSPKLVTKPNCSHSSWPRDSKNRRRSSPAFSSRHSFNHGLAGALGAWITHSFAPEALCWVLGLSFIAMAIWTMFPDEIEEDETQVARQFGVFGATLITFFLAEMGDKTQLATVAMAADCGTLGMLLADVPAVFVGQKLAAKIPMKLVHSVAAATFMLPGVATLLGTGAKLGV